MKQRNMDIVGHLTELRARLIWVIAVLVLALIGGLFAAGPIIEYLKDAKPATDVSLNVFSPWDAIRIYMNVAFIVGLVVTLPVAFYHLWAFVTPALERRERRAAAAYIPFAVVLFLAGLGFGYFVVFPLAFYFATSVTHSLHLTETYGIAQYFGFMFNILLPLGVVFELPLVVMFLTKLRLITPKFLRRIRRYAYIVLVIVGTVITPPDAVSDIIVALPLILLYEFSVLLSTLVHRKLKK